MSLLIRILVTAAALWVATQIVPGIHFVGSVPALLGVALVFGAINAVIKPVVKILSLPLLILSLGLFTLVINALLLWLTSALSNALGLGFHVDGFWAAFLGALVVSIVSIVLNVLTRNIGKDSPVS